MKKTLISLKKYFKLFVVIILIITIIFLLLNQFVIRYRINNFININADEIIELKIMEIKKHMDEKHYIDEKQYYFKIEDGFDEKFLIEILE